ncbi:MAG TPA: SDR family NAD(P)-dependent oxidoreductase, partial [Ornithinibacter sp.]|nr:SDR family NAD(P)-dependent oxidoreductase [Ornithinibacter sp.]
MSTQRVAIVTGAARGIGAATAERLARVGFAVGVLDLDEGACEAVAGRIRDAGGRALGVGVDVTDAARVEAGVALVADELGPPVVLVNN